MSRAAPRLLAFPLVALLALLGRPATARDYGFALGPTTPLAPSDSLGVALALSAALAQSSATSALPLLRLRGEVQGLLGEGHKAALPTLLGEIGVQLRGLELTLVGGVELFGVAVRGDYTVFSTFGFVGGVGLNVRLSRRVRLTARGLLTWLPSFATARLAAPEGAAKPDYVFLATLVGFDVTFAGPPVDDDDL